MKTLALYALAAATGILASAVVLHAARTASVGTSAAAVAVGVVLCLGIASGLLARIEPRRWLSLAAVMAAPVFLLGIAMFAALAQTGAVYFVWLGLALGGAVFAIAGGALSAKMNAEGGTHMKTETLYDFSAKTLAGENLDLKAIRGKVALIVNTASACGFTPQYAGIEELHKKYHAQGLEVLGFPCNQFGAQEPGDAAAIGAFCEKNYGVSFRMFDKVEVNGDHAHPLYQWLKSSAPGVLGTEAIKWNFTKFLVGRNGRVAGRYAPQTKPGELAGDIEKLLAAVL